MGESTGARAAAGEGAERRKARASGLSFDELARIRYKKRQGEVLYSDEEDAIGDGVAGDELRFRF